MAKFAKWWASWQPGPGSTVFLAGVISIVFWIGVAIRVLS